MSIVEVMVGAVMLLVCTPPILSCVVWMRSAAADASIDGAVANALNEQFSLVRSQGQSSPLTTGTTNSSQSLGSGVTLSTTRTITAVSNSPRLYRVVVAGTWTSRTRGGQSRSLTVETNVFAPEN